MNSINIVVDQKKYRKAVIAHPAQCRIGHIGEYATYYIKELYELYQVFFNLDS